MSFRISTPEVKAANSPFVRQLNGRAAALVLLLVTGLWTSACSSAGSPTAPSESTSVPPAAASAVEISGRVLDALTDAAVASAVIQSNGVATSSDGAGAFRLTTTGAANLLAVNVTLPGYVDRQTTLGAFEPATISLIASSFDLRAFDEMFRTPSLRRWTSAPPLRVLTTPLRFTNLTDSTFTATSHAMGEAEYNALVTDCSWALPQLTGDTFQAFTSVSREATAAGASVTVLTPGVITVATFDGLYQATGYWGYGRALIGANGEVVGGVMMLDWSVNRSRDSRLRAFRSHELGHALGYNHVASRTSVMNSAATTEPTAFDRDAARLAFDRRPGNRAPDNDAATASTYSHTSGAAWTQAVN